jgi:D-tyrosyl-tRNA(Tyr) deacylase
MRAIVQRVSQASVVADGEKTGEIATGLVALVAAHRDDSREDAAKMADRIWGLRIFNDQDGKINVSLRALHEAGEHVGVLLISNFTVYGETEKNRRPSFVESAGFEAGQELYEGLIQELRQLGCRVETGVFGADMKVSLTNDGPVTVILETQSNRYQRPNPSYANEPERNRA